MSSPKKNNKPKQAEQSERRITMRDIADEVGISHVAVSKALRGLSGVSEVTRNKVLKKADELGYVPDPLLGVLSHYRKSSKTKPVQAELAWLNTWSEPEKLRQLTEFDLYWQGASASAQRQGFHLEEFRLAEMPVQRLEAIFKARNIQGILIPPLRGALQADLERFNWSGFAVVRFGLGVPYPHTHYVTSAQMRNTIFSFDRTHELGYKRIGFVCEYWESRFFGVGYTWAQKKLPEKQRLVPLLLKADDNIDHQQEMLEKWIRKTRPDAILTDNASIPMMLQNLGYRIPEDFGVATTSINDTPIDAGIDQKPIEIGRAAFRILTALMAEKNYGIPETCNEILIEGKWVDGSMLPRREA